MIKDCRIFVFFILLPVYLTAQYENIKFEHLSVQQGLSSMNVYSIYQDHLGFLWFGTEMGLNKYDGYEMKHFVRNVYDSSSLSHNSIFCMSEDQYDNLWIGTGFNGINVYNRDKDNFQPVYPPGLYTKSIFNDHSGTLWIGTDKKGGGLYKLILKNEEYSDSGYKFYNYVHNSSNQGSLSHSSATCIFEDSNKNLWIGTHNGINRLNKISLLFQYHHSQNPEGHCGQLIGEWLAFLHCGTNSDISPGRSLFLY